MLLREKEKIEEWLNQYDIEKYELIEDIDYGYVVNVNSHVYLHGKELKNIDVKFNIINGYFDCSYNELKSLIGCPEIVNGSFICSHNNLTSLIGAPKSIDGSFYCSNNKLKSLQGCPEFINGNFFCNNNKLIVNGIINLKFLDIKNNYIYLENNKKLGELQYITDLNEVKNILQIYQEKKELNSLIITNDNLINKKNIIKI